MFELTLLLDLLSLDIWNEEAANEVLDENLGLVLLRFDLVDELVQGLGLELSLLERLHARRFVDRLVEDVLQVAVDRALVDGHQLLVEHVLAISQDLLGLSAAGLFGLALSSHVLSDADHVGDLALLLQADELLRKVVHGLRDDAGLDGLGDAVEQSLLIVLEDDLVLVARIAGAGVVLAGAQLGDELESLLLALEHHVLVRSAADQSLQ